MSPSIIDKVAKRFLPESVRFPIRYARHLMALRMQALRDLIQRGRYNGIPLPPPYLRYRVQGRVDSGGVFLNTGINCTQNVRSAVGRLGRKLHDFQSVLDFGCGCGRLLRWLRETPGSCSLQGCDIDMQAVDWCRKWLPFCAFKVNDPKPPLPFEGDTFDLTLCLSVISHLDAPLQEMWLGELKRVARKDGILLVTFFGRTAWKILKKEEKASIEAKGFLFKTGMTGRFKLDGLPDTYQSAYQTKENALDLCSRFFTVNDYIEGGLANCEDMAILINDGFSGGSNRRGYFQR